MSNFMGPMAPPPAAQPQPQALDFKTDPNQRQRFRQFMRERVGSGAAQAPAAMPNGIGTTMPTPSMPMPQIPMMPQPPMMPPMPMGAGIDVFSPQYMNQIPMQPSAGFHEGGIVGGLNDLGQMSSQMVEALNTTIYGGGQGGGGGYGGGMPPPPSGPMSTGGGFGGGNMPPPLPAVDDLEEMPRPVFNLIPDEIQNTMYGGIPGADNSGAGTGLASTVAPSPDGLNPSIQDTSSSPVPQDVAFAYAKAQEDARKQREGGFLGRVMLPGEMSFEDFSQGYNYRLNNPQPPLAVISQPGFGDGTMANLMDVGPTGGVTSGQMPPGFTPLSSGELGFTEDMMEPFEAYAGGKYFDESTGLYTGPERLGPEYKFADGGSVSDALADALSNDIGDYSFDDTFTDLSQTSYNDFDPGGNESFDAAAMDQFRNQQKSDLSDIIGQQIQSSIKSNQQMGTPAPVPQSVIEQMQFENLQNVPSTEPVFSMPSLNLGGMSTSFDLLGNPLTLGFKDGGSVPPRETDIRGMYHELAYITPDEADILEALGGTGEAGPMGIPAYRPGGDDVGSENAGSGDHSGGEGSASGANSGSDSSSDSDSSNDSDNASDDDMGDVGVMDGPGYSNDDDPFAGEEGDDFSSGNYGNDDGSFDANDFADFGVQEAKDRAVKDAFVTDRFGNPIGTKSGYVTQGAASDATKAAGYQALGLPDPNSDLASADVEASYGVPANSINSVSASPPGTTNKTDLLGFNYDLLQSNIDKAIEARKGMPTQASPLIGSPFAAGVTSSGINAAKDRLSARTGSNTSAPSSNVVSDFSPTPADQLDKEYGMPAGYFAGLDDLVDDDFASIGNRLGAGVEGVGTGYTDQGLPVGLEFATNPQTGAQITTNLAGLTEQQKANQPFSMDIAQFIGSNPYGYEIDPATGNPIGQVGTAPFGILGGLTTLAQDLIMGKPQTTQDLIERGAYTGMTGQNNDDDIFGGGGDDDVILPPDDTEEEVAPPPIVQMPGFFGPPPAPTEPAPVLVPSTRVSGQYTGKHLLNNSMPVGYGTPQTGQIDPYAMAEMQRYKEMLARLNQPRSPIGLANGGSVLDAAAGKFLESLTAA